MSVRWQYSIPLCKRACEKQTDQRQITLHNKWIEAKMSEMKEPNRKTVSEEVSECKFKIRGNGNTFI